MRAMDVGVEAAASPQCMVPLQARLELVNAIGQLNVSLPSKPCFFMRPPLAGCLLLGLRSACCCCFVVAPIVAPIHLCFGALLRTLYTQ